MRYTYTELLCARVSLFSPPEQRGRGLVDAVVGRGAMHIHGGSSPSLLARLALFMKPSITHI